MTRHTALHALVVLLIIALAICADGLMDKLGLVGFLAVSGGVLGLAAGLRYLAGRAIDIEEVDEL